MYGLSQLKKVLKLSETSIECPVVDCKRTVERQRRGDSFRHERFFCPEHDIFISPSTFEYLREEDNLLWNETADRSFLDAVRVHKRESRMARDNSEDALTWNTFRYFQRAGALDHYLATLAGENVVGANITYWSYSEVARGALRELNEVRLEFGEDGKLGSEPDLIIVGQGKVFWVEAKLNATNNTVSSNADNLKKYVSGGNGWFNDVFLSNYRQVAVTAQRYEMMRLWLLGSRMAVHLNCRFYLVSLMKNGLEETRFLSHIKQNEDRRLLRTTWEDMNAFIAAHSRPSEERAKISSYLEEKSVGYDGEGELKPAFPGLSQK